MDRRFLLIPDWLALGGAAQFAAMPRKTPFILVDVFTSRPFGGNQLAVFTEGAATQRERDAGAGA